MIINFKRLDLLSNIYSATHIQQHTSRDFIATTAATTINHCFSKYYCKTPILLPLQTLKLLYARAKRAFFILSYCQQAYNKITTGALQ